MPALYEQTCRSDTRLAKLLRKVEASTVTPRPIARMINWLRKNSDVERRFIRDPLQQIPELAISRRARLNYGNEALANRQIAEALVMGVQHTHNADVIGDVCEFGTMTGRTATVLAAAMASFRRPGTLNLFDSFEGMPQATAARDQGSLHVQSGAWAAGSCRGVSPRSLREKCERYLPGDKIVVHQGWFDRTVINFCIQSSSAAMVHVDCDLFKSTCDALNTLFVYKRVAPGAAIFFDDWNCNRASDDRGERAAWARLVHAHRIVAEPWLSYGCAGKAFIIHAYGQI